MPLLPSAKKLGWPRTMYLREKLNAILCMARTGCQRRVLPKEFSPRSTTRRYFYAWRPMEERSIFFGVTWPATIQPSTKEPVGDTHFAFFLSSMGAAAAAEVISCYCHHSAS